MPEARAGALHVGFVTVHSFPDPREVRIVKMVAALQGRGHRCTVFCPDPTGRARPDESTLGERIVRRPLSGRRIGRLLEAPTPINRGWARWLFERFRSAGIDVVIARDLRLTHPAIRAARRLGIPVVVDLAEHYPGLMKIVRKGLLADLSYRNPLLISRIERHAAGNADQVWVVCEENAARLKRYNGAVHVVSNYPLKEEIPQALSSPHRAYGNPDDPVRIISFGLINEIRGLDLAIRSFSRLVDRLPHTRLVIFGDGPSRPALQELAGRSGLVERVEFRGAVPFEERYRAMSEGDVGIIFHRLCELTHHTVPNKLFDYMSVAMPVATTPLRPVTRIVRREGCGIVLDPNPDAIACGLADLVRDRERRRAMGERGRAAIDERYLWEVEGAKACRLVEELVSQDP